MENEVKNNSKRLLSIIVVNHCEDENIFCSLDGLKAQSIFNCVEIIMVDQSIRQEGFADTKELLGQYPNIVYLRPENKGTFFDAVNLGIKSAHGDYVTILADNEPRNPDFLKRLSDVLSEKPDVAVVYADCAVAKGPTTSFYGASIDAHILYPEFDIGLLFCKNIIGQQSMWRTSLHNTYGYFSDNRNIGVYQFWLTIAANGERFYHLPEIMGLNFSSVNCLKSAEIVIDKESRRVRNKLWLKKWGRRKQKRFDLYRDVPLYVNVRPAHLIPLVSVIVPTCNRGKMLSCAVHSILNQTLQNFEIIIINDRKDDVDTLLEGIDPQHRIRIINNGGNHGVVYSRNAGIAAANGRYIAYLDDDDLFYRDHLQTTIGFLQSTNHSVVYTDAYCAFQHKKGEEYITSELKLQYSNDFCPRKILWRNLLPMICLVHEKTCCEKIGWFDEALETHEDWDFIIRLSRQYEMFHLKKITAEYSMRDNQTNATSKRALDFLTTQIKMYEKYKEFSIGDRLVKRKQLQSIKDRKTSLKKKGFSKKEISEACIL